MVGMDAALLASGHAIRGIGRYVSATMAALLGERPEWCREHLGLLVERHQPAPGPCRVIWPAHRARWRAQDIGWLVAALADQLATARSPRAAVWHQTDPATPLGPLPADRTIMTVYDLIPLRDHDVMARIRPHRRWVYELYLHRVRSARLVVAISETTARDVKAILGVPASRIRIVPPAVSPCHAPGPGVEAAAPPGGPPDFLFIGVPDPHKRPDLAISAFSAYARRGNRGRLLFVGHHPPRDRRFLVSLATSAGVADRVDFIGRIEDDRLCRLYGQSVLLALSRLEGFGLPGVEALVSGGRVVATPEPIYREVVGNSASYAAEATPGAVADAMEQAAETPPDPGAAAALASRYSSRRVADAMVAAYDDALEP